MASAVRVFAGSGSHSLLQWCLACRCQAKFAGCIFQVCVVAGGMRRQLPPLRRYVLADNITQTAFNYISYSYPYIHSLSLDQLYVVQLMRTVWDIWIRGMGYVLSGNTDNHSSLRMFGTSCG